MQKLFKGVLTWLFAILFGFLIVNICCFFYERPVGWYDTEHGASRALWNPGTYLIHGQEGYSITKIDRYGYTNEDKPLDDSYILVMGSSHTQGKEVYVDKRYTTLLNRELADGTDRLTVFNIANDGHFLPSLIKHFKAALTAYPDATIVVLEIGSTDYPVDEIERSYDQVEFNPAETAKAFQTFSSFQKAKLIIKEYLPLVNLIKKQISTAKDAHRLVDEYQVDASAYKDAIDRDLSLIRSEYDGNIVFLYHPNMTLLPDGTLKLNYSLTWDAFAQACRNNRIDVIDMGPVFEEAYLDSYQLPMGFSNTLPGEGHLNTIGHQLAAKALADYVEAKEK